MRVKNGKIKIEGIFAMNMKNVSKKMCFILRHRPELYNLPINEEGWVRIDDLFYAMKKDDRNIKINDIIQIANMDDKKRYQISNDGRSIRAVQGHSTPLVDRNFKKEIPPQYLFHGTPETNIQSIAREGLAKKGRHHVHLSPTRALAEVVGSRRGEAKVYTIMAKRMHDDGHAFYKAENNVWLTDHVPPTYIMAV